MTYSANREIKGLRRGKYVCIENKDVEWWKSRLAWGFFDAVESRGFPVKVIQENSTKVFSGGMNKSQVNSIIRHMKKNSEFY